MGILDALFGGNKVVPTPVRTEAQYREQVLDSEQPVIVDVWSPTCGPCKKLVPVLTEVATAYEGRVRVVEIDVSQAEPEVLGRLQVRATPTLIIVDEGEEVGRMTGFRPKGWFQQMIATEFPDV